MTRIATKTKLFHSQGLVTPVQHSQQAWQLASSVLWEYQRRQALLTLGAVRVISAVTLAMAATAS